MVKRCADSGFDLAAGKVGRANNDHFMGGVVVDVDTVKPEPGLYVAAWMTGGAHGSNRLGGNGVANSRYMAVLLNVWWECVGHGRSRGIR